MEKAERIFILCGRPGEEFATLQPLILIRSQQSLCRKARTRWVGVAGKMKNACVRTAHTLHAGYGLLIEFGNLK